MAARYGVVGEPIPVRPTAEWMERLKTFKCQIYDQSGKMLVEAPGSSLLDHPINVVLWIRDSLKKDGIALKKGDLRRWYDYEADADGIRHDRPGSLRRPGSEGTGREHRNFR